MDRSRGRLLAVVALLAFAAPSILLAGTALFGRPVPGALVLAALAVPLGAIALGLLYVGRQVASSPDEPSLIDERLGERLDMTSEEYRNLTEE